MGKRLSFPDISLYKKICTELGINIEELINGEKDNSDESKEKAIILKAEKTKKVKHNFKRNLTIFLLILVIFIGSLIYYNKHIKVNLIRNSDFL